LFCHYVILQNRFFCENVGESGPVVTVAQLYTLAVSYALGSYFLWWYISSISNLLRPVRWKCNIAYLPCSDGRSTVFRLHIKELPLLTWMQTPKLRACIVYIGSLTDPGEWRRSGSQSRSEYNPFLQFLINWIYLLLQAFLAAFVYVMFFKYLFVFFDITRGMLAFS